MGPQACSKRERGNTIPWAGCHFFLFAFLVTSHVCNQDGRVHPPRRPFLHYLAQTQEACSAFAIGDACFSLWKFAFVQKNTLFWVSNQKAIKYFRFSLYLVGEKLLPGRLGKVLKDFSQAALLIYSGQKKLAFLSSAHFKF